MLKTSRAVLPLEWTSTMRPLQDKCEPTPYEDLERMFSSDMGIQIPQLFEDFDPEPIGVASLAQVHVGRHRETGKRVAVKVSFRTALGFSVIIQLFSSYNILI